MKNRLALFFTILLCSNLLSSCGNSLESALATVKEGNVQEAKQMIDASPGLAKAKNNTGNTILFESLRYGHEDLAKYVVQKGADVNLKNSQGVTPIYFAQTPGMAKFLIENGADKDIKTFEGTPLHWAAKFNYPELVKFYITEGLPLNHKSGRGNTALDLAIERDNKKVISILESAIGEGEG